MLFTFTVCPVNIVVIYTSFSTRKSMYLDQKVTIFDNSKTFFSIARNKCRGGTFGGGGRSGPVECRGIKRYLADFSCRLLTFWADLRISPEPRFFFSPHLYQSSFVNMSSSKSDLRYSWSSNLYKHHESEDIFPRFWP